MDLIDSLVRRVRNASPYARTALVAECGDRVFPVYEEYWVGTYYPEVGRSIEIGWSYACGAKVEASEIQSCLVRVEGLVEFYYEEGRELLASTVTVVLRILESMSPVEEESCLAVARGLIYAVDTANQAEAMASQTPPSLSRTRVAREEERAWQNQALQLINGWQGFATRNMFDSLDDKPPRWLLDWKLRSRR
jgi:hypothetical protein